MCSLMNMIINKKKQYKPKIIFALAIFKFQLSDVKMCIEFKVIDTGVINEIIFNNFLYKNILLLP